MQKETPVEAALRAAGNPVWIVSTVLKIDDYANAELSLFDGQAASQPVPLLSATRVSGGTYLIKIEAKTEILEIFVTPAADLRQVAALVKQFFETHLRPSREA